MPALREKFHCFQKLVKRKNTVHHRFDSGCLNSTAHRFETVPMTDGDSLQTDLAGDDQPQLGLHFRSRKHSDHGNRSTRADRPQRLRKCFRAADFDDVVDSLASGKFPDLFSPFRIFPVVQHFIGSKILGPLHFFLTPRNHHRPCANHFRKLQGKQGNAAGTLNQYRISGFEPSFFDQGTPGGEGSAGKGGCFQVA